MQLNNKVAVITGGGSGIGAAVAERFAREGATVVVADHDEAGARTVVERIASDGGKARAAALDVRDGDAVEVFFRSVVGQEGAPSIVVTSAGISRRETLLDTLAASWDEVFAVNVRGTFLCAKAAVHHMLQSGGGSIITVASQLAFGGGRGNPAYIASKGAIVSFTRSLALDYAQSGIRVNALVPGATVTPLMEGGMNRQPDPEAARNASRARHAMKRFGQVDEIAFGALYLASDEASFVTGTMLPIDGGWMVG
ncbi:MAG: glucose 1-dehydrogenase [Pseudomonadota bacterium]